jgi:DNA-binding Xre family transcriptional regulator
VDDLVCHHPFTSQENVMIKVKVPELLKEQGMNATDLMRHGNIAYATALRLSKGEGTSISYEVLENLCKLFGVQVGDILEYSQE